MARNGKGKRRETDYSEGGISKRQQKLASLADPGKNEKEKGSVRNNRDGSLSWWNETAQHWAPAVYHNDIRQNLIERASQNGLIAYQPPRESGELPWDETAYQPEQDDWNGDRNKSNIRDDILNRLDKAGYVGRDDDIDTDFMFEGVCLVIDEDNNPVKVFTNINNLDNLPATLSSQIEDWYIEAITRLDTRIKRIDILARCPREFRKGKAGKVTPIFTCQALGNRKDRYRVKEGLISWDKRTGTDNMTEYLTQRLPAAAISSNSIRGIPPLTPLEQLQARSANRGNFLQKANGRNLSDEERQSRENKIMNRKWHTYDPEQVGAAKANSSKNLPPRTHARLGETLAQSSRGSNKDFPYVKGGLQIWNSARVPYQSYDPQAAFYQASGNLNGNLSQMPSSSGQSQLYDETSTSSKTAEASEGDSEDDEDPDGIEQQEKFSLFEDDSQEDHSSESANDELPASDVHSSVEEEKVVEDTTSGQERSSSGASENDDEEDLRREREVAPSPEPKEHETNAPKIADGQNSTKVLHTIDEEAESSTSRDDGPLQHNTHFPPDTIDPLATQLRPTNQILTNNLNVQQTDIPARLHSRALHPVTNAAIRHNDPSRSLHFAPAAGSKRKRDSDKENGLPPAKRQTTTSSRPISFGNLAPPLTQEELLAEADSRMRNRQLLTVAHGNALMARGAERQRAIDKSGATGEEKVLMEAEERVRNRMPLSAAHAGVLEVRDERRDAWRDAQRQAQQQGQRQAQQQARQQAQPATDPHQAAPLCAALFRPL
ncbi:uncharacterized protein KY384_000841 [Bacidia gigantensis]|uniref:uncharacterized protein n=1 Tax=Bacidia gigantensis TaxID=2732470 RepID=UPI001D05624D|nr:uncharacterized protein KY384_000841 [Bacidia gigantensis]KAG8533999.1 hypothetical protein KY384_000841 [Bacidia gigantensis]